MGGGASSIRRNSHSYVGPLAATSKIGFNGHIYDNVVGAMLEVIRLTSYFSCVHFSA